MYQAIRISVGVLTLLFGWALVVRGEPRPHQVDTVGLVRVEQSQLPPALVPGPPTHDNLPAYYFAANPELRDRFEHFRSLYEKGVTRPTRAITLVAGDAGVGKTFLKKEVFRKDYAPGSTLKIDLREQYEQWAKSGLVAPKPDLACDDVTINRLLCSPAESPHTPLFGWLESQSARFIVIDSIDEIHPDDYAKALRDIEQFVFSSQQPFVHVVVFGRPCGLVDYWTDGRSGDRDIRLIALRPPVLRTVGDLQVSSWNYYTWRFKARIVHADGQEEPLPLDRYVQWSEFNFAHSGPFREIVCEPNEEIDPQVRDALVDCAQHVRGVGPMLCNLAGNSILREIVAERAHEHRAFEERQVLDAYFAAWLERSYQSDGRPSYDHADHVGLYVQLLENIAASYAAEGKVDARGYFTVEERDRVDAEYRGRRLSFSVRQVLDRSGLQHLNPNQGRPRQYRFEPIQLHRYLVERHNERPAPLVLAN